MSDGLFASATLIRSTAFPWAVEENGIGWASVRYQSSLTLREGCHPYAAVDRDGNVGGGLQAKGNPTGGESYTRSSLSK